MKKFKIIIIVFALAGLITSGVLYIFVNRSVSNQLKSTFINESESQFNVLKESVDNNSIVVESLERFFASSEYISRTEFSLFTRKLLDYLHGVVSLEYSPKVTDENKNLLIEQTQIDEISDFQIFEFSNNKRIISPIRDFYYPIYYIEPYESNEHLLGLNIYSEYQLKDSIDTALQTNSLVITEPLKLMGEIDHSLSYAMIQQISGTNDLILGIVRFESLFNRTLASFDNQSIDIFAFDTTHKNNIQFMHHYLNNIYPIENYSIDFATLDVKESLYLSKNIYFGNRKWTLIFIPTENFFQVNDNDYDRIILIFSLLIVLLTTVYFYMILRHNRKLELEVLEKTIELEELAIKDPLTGLFNRRKLFEEITSFINRYDRMQEIFSIIMIDLDLFKEINDQYGHDVGDYILKSFSDFMTEAIRENDLLVRYGGEEFVILFENVGRETAKEILDRILDELNIKIHEFKGHTIQISFSAGISDVTESKDSYTLIKLADQRMYDAKESGRNQVLI